MDENVADDRLASAPLDDRQSSSSSEVGHPSAVHLEFLSISHDGSIFLVGWVDDFRFPLLTLQLTIDSWTVSIERESVARIRRTDVEAVLSVGNAHHYGFWVVAQAAAILPDEATCRVSAASARGDMVSGLIGYNAVPEMLLRSTVNDFLAEGQPGYDSLPENVEALTVLMGRPVEFALPTSSSRRASRCDPPRCTTEVVLVSEGGGIMLAGWIDDRTAPLRSVRVSGFEWSWRFDRDGIGRSCRDDVQRELQSGHDHPFAFWSFATAGEPLATGATMEVEIETEDGAVAIATLPTRRLTDLDLRSAILSQIGSARFAGNRAADSMTFLDGSIGEHCGLLNTAITAAFLRQPYVARFGSGERRAPPRASIVVCLYGKSEFLFLQAAMFSAQPGTEDYEFVYVSNSPELSERLLNDAEMASWAYGVAITLVLLGGNAGFSAANNAAVPHCRSDRIIFINPDVFPYDGDWASKHSAVVEQLPQAQTRLFGVPLYYEDGSLMHGGMFIEADTVLSVVAGILRPRQALRVEHYGKGAPPGTLRFTRSRPVPAVTGAFISCERAWFESLGGFTEDYVFGHYEDADLSLKSLERGTPAWMHDIRMWHLEGKGSTRLALHEGSVLLNRWLFSRRWAEKLCGDLCGPSPTHPLLAESEGHGPVPPMASAGASAL